MFAIKFKVGDYTGEWCDPSIRGNIECMIYHDEGNARTACDHLNLQYSNEGYSFFFEPVV